MSAQNSQDAVKSFLRAEFRREQESGFALLRRTPSTSKRKFVDYCLALNEPAQNALSEALAQVALCLFFPSAPHPSKSGNTAYKKFCDAMVLGWDWKCEGVRMLRMTLAEAERVPDSPFADGMTPEIREMIRAIKPVKSTEIRKVVKLALSQLFVPINIVNRGGGNWLYEGLYQGREISVTIDYGGMNTQLRYEIAVRDKDRSIVLEGLSYERMMGLSFAHWDCLEQSNLDQSIALLKDFIIYCAEIPARLPAEYRQETNKI